MAHGVLGAAFLRDLRRLLAPRGEVAFNLWRSAYLADQMRRIERAFSIIAVDEADDNLIVHATPRHDERPLA
jgi:spermidine synthase